MFRNYENKLQYRRAPSGSNCNNLIHHSQAAQYEDRQTLEILKGHTAVKRRQIMRLALKVIYSLRLRAQQSPDYCSRLRQ